MVDARRVWMIRHGQSESNAGLPTNGPAAAPLTERGRDQAVRTSAVFTEQPARIVSSPFVRARQTAEETVSRFPATPYEEWPVQEFTYLGALHAARTTNAQRQPHIAAYWERNEPAYVHGDTGESFVALIARVHAFLDRLAALPDDDGLVAVFTHGLFMKAVMWTLVSGVQAPDARDMRAFRGFLGACDVPNCAIVELWRPNGAYGFRLVGGGVTHLAGAPVESGSPAALD
ncbi:histidine phosphatase family protein [Actinocorallia sp. A-T 12471]|uniref:histidine phosphatase family protein n=1 Tax=Actinocorallia sp. A-T 12471 TaxID=3089813 RepID=UPI0029D011AA|nr:histidine phosphatase family protein [Actinocorallia sp. A-T 12471]MDX6741989.1 histidine phosphatase family protein [Actinocorallia sp. A-T 12471]